MISTSAQEQGNDINGRKTRSCRFRGTIASEQKNE
jgi:hypothetical protein